MLGVFESTKDMDLFHRFANDNNVIFDSTVNPEKEDSPFYTHKLNVIKNAIQYNLNLALSSYDVMAGTMDIQMPVISDDEWDKILTNVSIVSFMQGFNCGMKIYNNYAIVSSTNNELTVIPNEIYYAKKGEFNSSETMHLYHRIDCEELTEDQEYISFTSKEIKYDKIYDKASQTYKYDHRNNGCYSCIIGSNYLKKINAAGDMGYSNEVIISALSPTKQKEYYRAVGKERQNLYKTNALTSSNGYEVVYTAPSDTANAVTFGNGESRVQIAGVSPSTGNINKIKEIEITIRDIKSNNPDEPTAAFNVSVNGQVINENLVVNLGQATPQTITVPVHIEQNSKLTNLELVKMNPADVVECNILSVRIIYE